MAIEFSCDNCGKHLRAPDDAAGRKSRCPDCGNIATVPDAGPPPLPSASRSGGDVPQTKPSRRGKPATSEPNWAVRIIGGMVGVALLLVIVVGVYGHFSNKKKAEERERLTRLVDEQIGRATPKADAFDFDGAIAALDDAAQQVGASFLSNEHIRDELNDTIEVARNDVRRSEGDYRKKVRDGWVMFEGTFMPGANKQQILTERQNVQEERRRRVEAAKAEFTVFSGRFLHEFDEWDDASSHWIGEGANRHLIGLDSEVNVVFGGAVQTVVDHGSSIGATLTFKAFYILRTSYDGEPLVPKGEQLPNDFILEFVRSSAATWNVVSARYYDRTIPDPQWLDIADDGSSWWRMFTDVAFDANESMSASLQRQKAITALGEMVVRFENEWRAEHYEEFKGLMKQFAISFAEIGAATLQVSDLDGNLDAVIAELEMMVDVMELLQDFITRVETGQDSLRVGGWGKVFEDWREGIRQLKDELMELIERAKSEKNP